MAVIPKDRWAQRVGAALELRGKAKGDLTSAVQAVKDRTGDPDLKPSNALKAMQPYHVDVQGTTKLAEAVAEALSLPVEWFTVEDFDKWLSRASTPAAGSDLADELRGVRMEVRGGLSAVRTEQERQRQLLEQLGDDEGSAGSG